MVFGANSIFGLVFTPQVISAGWGISRFVMKHYDMTDTKNPALWRGLMVFLSLRWIGKWGWPHYF